MDFCDVLRPCGAALAASNVFFGQFAKHQLDNCTHAADDTSEMLVT